MCVELYAGTQTQTDVPSITSNANASIILYTKKRINNIIRRSHTNAIMKRIQSTNDKESFLRNIKQIRRNTNELSKVQLIVTIIGCSCIFI